MPDPAATSAAPDAMRLILFGPPGAGKTSLLGALPHAAGIQPHPLDHALPAEKEGVPYSIAYESENAVVLDADGHASDAILRDHAIGTLAREMLHADALVLAVDASAPPERLDADFADFDHFLRWMEQHRGTRTDVGGLPVFLVLTKCDLLARPGETTADWLERIEERKREVGDRFHDYLAGRVAAKPPAAFGGIHLHLWATAVGRPTLAGAAARPTEPYGVAELFRQCLDQATAYRARREQSARRLVRMTAGMAAAVLVLLAAAGSLLATDTLRRPPTELEYRVERLRRADPKTPAERLRGSPEQLRQDAADWQAMKANAEFAALPVDLQAYVAGRLSELDAYVPWLEKLEETPRPRDALAEEEIRALQVDLAGSLAPPRPGWEATEAGVLWSQTSAEAKTMTDVIETLQTWYGDSYNDGHELLLSAGRTGGGSNWNGWNKEVEAWLRKWCVPPDADPTERVADDSPLTYADVKEFGSVASARAQWKAMRERLRRLRDTAAALGLIQGLPGKPDLLVVPASGLSLDEAAQHFQDLQTDYPDFAKNFVKDRSLPSAVADRIAEQARTQYDLLLEPAQALVRARLRASLPADADTPERWAAVREWLRDPKELAGWRGLAVALARLADADAPDPVDALAAFLDTKTFSIELNGFTVVMPDVLKVSPLKKVNPLRDVPLTVHCGNTTLEFDPIKDRGMQTSPPQYGYRAKEPGRKVVYEPGQEFYAELRLTDGKTLRWDRAGSRLYAFEVLRNVPELLEAGQSPGEGKRTREVRLDIRPNNGVPTVPDLIRQADRR